MTRPDPERIRRIKRRYQWNLEFQQYQLRHGFWQYCCQVQMEGYRKRVAEYFVEKAQLAADPPPPYVMVPYPLYPIPVSLPLEPMPPKERP